MRLHIMPIDFGAGPEESLPAARLIAVSRPLMMRFHALVFNAEVMKPFSGFIHAAAAPRRSRAAQKFIISLAAKVTLLSFTSIFMISDDISFRFDELDIIFIRHFKNTSSPIG